MHGRPEGKPVWLVRISEQNRWTRQCGAYRLRCWHSIHWLNSTSCGRARAGWTGCVPMN